MSIECPAWSSAPESIFLKSPQHLLEQEVAMKNQSFKIIERSSVEQVVAIAAKLIERGYKPVAEIMKMPATGLFTQVMHWERK